jgi:tol-pal system protein YbgF
MAVLRRYRYREALFLVTLAALTLAACAKMPWPGSSSSSAPEAAPEAPPSNLADLQSMVAEDHQAIKQLIEHNQQLEAEVKALRERTEVAATAPVVAAAPVPVSPNETQMAAINQRLTKLESTSNAVQNTLSRAIGRAIRPQGASSEEPVPLPSYDAVLDHEIGLLQGEHRQQLADQHYRDGLIALRGFRWATAIDEFTSLVRHYPRSPYIERARYFTAIAYYQDGRYDTSISQFRDFVNRYPRGRYTSSAMLSMALAYAQVKDQANARATLKRVISDYPGSSEAGIAQATLKNLDAEAAQAHK